ncbi:MAG: TRAP transporter substrate-binding protein DctP [Beijerinckiaceae bacterium]
MSVFKGSISATGFAAAAAFVLGAGQAGAVDLVYGSWPPAVEYVNSKAMPKLAKEVAEETKGALNWKIIPGGQLANAKTTFDNVKNGVMAAGLAIPTYAPNLLPATSSLIYSNVVFGDHTVAASGAAVETMVLNCPQCQEEFRKQNAVALSGWTTSPYRLTCRTPVATLADLKGKRVRVTGNGNTNLIKMLGGVPVGANLVEAVGLLQRGGIDCTFGVDYWLKAFGYADFAKYITEIDLGLTGPAIGLYMNRKVWSSFTREQKLMHMKKAAYMSGGLAIGQFIIDNEANLQYVIKEKGVKLVKPTNPAEWQAVVNKFDEEQQKINLAAAKRFRVKDGEKVIAAYRKNVEKWKGFEKEIGRDIQKFADILWREAYSKVDPDKL